MENEYKLPENLTGKASIEELKYILERGERALAGTRESDNRVTSRSITLLGFIIGILLTLSGYLFSQIIGEGSINYHSTFTAIITSSYLYLVCLYLHKNILGLALKKEGTLPKRLFTETFIFLKGTTEERLRFFYEAGIQNTQRALDYNMKEIEVKWNKYDLSLKGILLLPIILLGTYLFTYIIF